MNASSASSHRPDLTKMLTIDHFPSQLVVPVFKYMHSTAKHIAFSKFNYCIHPAAELFCAFKLSLFAHCKESLRMFLSTLYFLGLGFLHLSSTFLLQKNRQASKICIEDLHICSLPERKPRLSTLFLSRFLLFFWYFHYDSFLSIFPKQCANFLPIIFTTILQTLYSCTMFILASHLYRQL